MVAKKNYKLFEHYRDVDVVKRIQIGIDFDGLRTGHLARMSEEETIRQVFHGRMYGTRRRARSNIR